ncbi:MAG TPA: DUF5916 domain-containing protein [Melioribacteraceae bacterium]|nr:DUF5916 domain-containing protein [Melioribacteraceae bacterium]
MNKSILLFFIIICFCGNLIFAQIKECYAVKTDSKVIIDGKLDDISWQNAKVIDDFLEQDPKIGNKPRFKTEVRILYDTENLYFGISCFDDEPEKLLYREMKWDGYLSKDDYFRIMLDTYNDNRNAYWFAINPLGAQNDALISGLDMSGFNEDWDGVWEVKTDINENGWFIEVRYPFSTFRFLDGEEQIWGINFERGVKRYDESYLWTSVGQNKGLFKIAEAGDLKGINGVKRGDPIYILPYVSAGAQNINSKKDYLKDIGVDIKYGLTETLSLDVTVNTDFAQIEADRSKINLTRFPLYFAEKRDFFLEGVNTFKFNLGGSNTIYYSRRMGISDGNEIPIIGGVKLVGRTDRFEIGFLNLQTAKKNDIPTTNYSTMRVKYDLLNQSYAGIMITNKLTKNGYNSSLGADFSIQSNSFLGDNNVIFTSRLAKTYSGSYSVDYPAGLSEYNSQKNSYAGFFSFDFPNDLIDQYISYSFFQKNFNPAVGFISRKGIQKYEYSLDIKPRINKYGIRRLYFTPLESGFYLDKDNILQQASFFIQPIGFSLESGENFYLGFERNFDYVKETYTIFDTTKVYPNKYWYNTFLARFTSSTSEAIYGELDFEKGNFYNGKITGFSGNITTVLSKHFIFEGDFNFNKIEFAHSSFSTYELGGRLKVNFSTKLLSSVFCQWNNAEKEVNINYRINWKPKIGSDFYLVINQLLETENKIKSKDFVILAKFSWLFII